MRDAGGLGRVLRAPCVLCTRVRGVLWEVGLSTRNQVEDHRKTKGARVACGSCDQRSITAKDVADESKRVKRLLTFAARTKQFA